MPWIIQVRVRDNRTKEEHWEPLRPTNGAPYTWDTQDAAERAMQNWYGSVVHHNSVRVVVKN